jgi:hypothetical protein
MAEQWEKKTDDARVADQVPTYIIYCEDEVHEPAYFSTFNKVGVLRVSTVPNQKQGKLNLNNTIADCVHNGLIKFENNLYQIDPLINEKIWCVYDRDMENTDFAKIHAAEHIDFNTSISQANGVGLQVAWSNDLFELWILLHFEMVPTGAIIHRDWVYERLTEVLIALPGQSAELAAMTSNANFTYRNGLKKRLPFMAHVLPLLPARQAQATERALALQAAFNDHTEFHLRNPCTLVNVLVSELQGILDLANPV